MPRIRAASIDEHKALTRTALLESAQELIAASGTAQVPLGEVALAAGIGRTTLYDYFTDRDDLIATLVEEELPAVIEGIVSTVPLTSSPADRLASLMMNTVEFVARDRVLGLILHRESGRMSLDAQQRIREAHSDLAWHLTEAYFDGVEAGVFKELPPDLAGRLIQDLIMSAAKTIIDSVDPDQRTPVVLESFRSFLLDGLSL